MAKYPEFIGIKVSEKTKFFLDETRKSRRDILELGLKQYYQENPKLKTKAEFKFLDYQKEVLNKQKADTDVSYKELEQSAMKLMVQFENINDVIEQYNIDEEHEFIKSFLEIKKDIDELGSIDNIKPYIINLQAGLCDMDPIMFKESCVKLLKSYEVDV